MTITFNINLFRKALERSYLNADVVRRRQEEIQTELLYVFFDKNDGKIYRRIFIQVKNIK